MGDERERALRHARDRLLAAMAPEATVQGFPWSGGRPEVLVPGRGPPLLLVHGGVGTSLQRAPILAALAEDRGAFAESGRGRVVAARTPGATSGAAADAGHLPWTDPPERVAAAMLGALVAPAARAG